MNATPATTVTVTVTTVDMPTVGWSTARTAVDEVREYTWTASHATKSRQFARMDDMWHGLCWKCGGSGNIGYGPDAGVCYPCLGHGLIDYWSDGEEFDTKLRNIERNVKAESTKQRKATEEAVAVVAAWRAAHPDLIAWAESVAPTGVERVDSYVKIEATEAEATTTPRPDTDRLERTETLDDGRVWALWAVELPVFAGYSTRVQDALRSVRAGLGLDAKTTELLRKVMTDDAARPALPPTRHAGAPGDRLSVTGRVVMIREPEDGGYLSVKVEGQGADTGLTFFTNTSSASAYTLAEGDLVTVKGTIKRNEEYRGIKSDRVGRAVFTPVDEVPAAPVATAPQAPVDTPAPAAPAAEPTPPQSDAKPARATGRRAALGASCVDGWELLYDKPRAGAEVVGRDGRYALACKAHKTLHHLARLSDEGKVRKAGGWCTQCQCQ